MRINFWKITDERNMFPKKLVDLLHPIPTTYIDGNLRDECDIINPIITIEGEVSKFQQYNYAYIADLYRYYFIEDWKIIRSKDVTVIEDQQEVVKHIQILEMTLHEDVLQSYYTYIMDMKAIITRTEMVYDTSGNSVADLMIVDSKWTSKPEVIETYIGYDDSDNSVHDGKNTFAHYSVSDKYNFIMTVGGLPYGS